MAIGRKRTQPEIAPSESPQAAASSHQQKVAEQIARLEERHKALISETSNELEELKRQLSEGDNITEQIAAAKAPLLAEIAALRGAMAQRENSNQALKGELERLQEEYQKHYSTLQSSLSALGNLVSEKPVTVEPLPVVTDENLEALLAEFSNPETQKPAVVEPPKVVLTEVPEVIEKPRKEKKQRSFKGVRKFAIRLVMLALIATGGYGGLKAIQKNNLESGAVAGVSTETTTETTTPAEEDTTQKNKESFAIVAFDQTEWDTFTDGEFGFSVRWPTNASNLSRTIGGNNIWFLRFNSYMMKVSKEDTSDTLDDWWNKTSGFFLDGASASKGTFKGRPAWIITPNEETKTSGKTYVVASKTGVLQIWVKDEDPMTDDGKRITKMLESLSFQ